MTIGFPGRALRTLIFPVYLLAMVPMNAAAAADFSADLDALWDFGKPVASEAKFRAELDKYPKDSREALEILTQIARTQGLRRQFSAADATLSTIEGKLDGRSARTRVRYLLERGRTRNSSGDQAAAVALFLAAVDWAGRDTAPGAEFYRVDALHMLGIAAPRAEQLDWNRRALAVAEGSTDARTRDWAMSLMHNIGWTYFEAGDVNTALAYWKRALPLRETQGKSEAIRVAKWTIARAYRALGQLDDAEEMQQKLMEEREKAGEPSGYVYEELAEIAVARGDTARAAPWAAKAHALLKEDGYLRDSEAARLSRLAALAAATSGK